MNRFLTLLLCFLFCISCAKKDEDPNTNTLWHWMIDRQEAFEQLALQYEQETGIKVKVDLFAPPESYTQRVIASAQAKISFLSRIPKSLLSSDELLFDNDQTLGMPTWFKTTAKWWIDGEISDEEFKKNVNFLRNEGLLRSR